MKQLIAHLDAGTTVDAGVVCQMSTDTYTDLGQAAREMDEFFGGLPQCVGMSGDLPESGSFLTISDLGIPILATRDGNGEFRAFVNSCRHRGAIVESGERGNKRRFTCPFHSWSYDSGGALVGLPKSDHFGAVDTDCLGLRQLPAEERHGLLFVHPNPEGSMDLDELLGEWFNEEFPTWNFAELIPLTSDVYDTACNWKLAMDTFGETYHFSSLHKDTLFNTFHGNVQCYDQDGHNHRMILCRRDIDEMRNLPEDQWDITVAGLPVYWIFPNVILMPFRHGVFLVRAYPIAGEPGRHISRIDFYVKPEVANSASAEATEMMMTIADGFAQIIRDEDYAMGASQQTSASASSLEYILFGRNEPALHHYHNTYRSKLGLDSLPTL
ncbi:aromatic ring-hydroxylating dioxygenase subunit alpha [Acidimicrobiaceae bacterium AH-315-P05]|nr:aromatic ring-hydroxylating dioxygenase subunit alpha [Acidimicrobiaceae bacterium AH-315-P05]